MIADCDPSRFFLIFPNFPSCYIFGSVYRLYKRWLSCFFLLQNKKTNCLHFTWHCWKCQDVELERKRNNGTARTVESGKGTILDYRCADNCYREIKCNSVEWVEKYIGNETRLTIDIKTIKRNIHTPTATEESDDNDFDFFETVAPAVACVAFYGVWRTSKQEQ